jgi:glutamine amidotransferase
MTQLKKRDVLVIDYGVGNHSSILNALSFLGYRYSVSNQAEDIKKAPAYILPGVGAYGEAMHNIEKLDIVDTLSEEVLKKKKPILGICLGMQLLAEDSEEKGSHRGLGFIKGHVVELKPQNKLRVPHVGWNSLKVKNKAPLFERTSAEPHFYFDHSYHFKCDDANISATCAYGEEITAAVQKDNIFGVQFHPEKGQSNGLKLFRGFFNYVKNKA